MNVFDPSLVEEAFGDDREGLLAFLRSVCNSVRTGLEKVRVAQAGGDAVVLRQAAHSLKGSSGHIGGEEVAAIAQRVELAARDGRIEPAATIDDLAAAVAHLEIEIGKYQKKLESA